MTQHSNAIGWSELLTFFSPAGQQQISDFIAQAKDQRGENWLPEIKAEFPLFSWIVDLVANRTADEAFEELQKTYPTYPLWIAKGQLINLHARLIAEIEKPR